MPNPAEAPAHSDDVTLVVLAGGRGRRMGGVPKGLMRLPSGETVVERLLALTDGPSLVSTNDPAAYERLEVPLVADVVADRGAPGGVVTGLAMASTEWVAVVACDMPFVTRAQLAVLLARRHAHCDAVCFTRDGEVEPLLGVFRRSLCHDWEARLDGHPSMKELINSVRVELVESTEPHRLMSLNSPADLESFRSFDASGTVGP
ncbi:MAG: molybdenum cofactor guanylyltransferase [Myxococcaceae bacterium]